MSLRAAALGARAASGSVATCACVCVRVHACVRACEVSVTGSGPVGSPAHAGARTHRRARVSHRHARAHAHTRTNFGQGVVDKARGQPTKGIKVRAQTGIYKNIRDVRDIRVYKGCKSI